MHQPCRINCNLIDIFSPKSLTSKAPEIKEAIIEYLKTGDLNTYSDTLKQLGNNVYLHVIQYNYLLDNFKMDFSIPNTELEYIKFIGVKVEVKYNA